MGRERQTIDIKPDDIVVMFALLRRDEDASAEILRRIERAPVHKQRELRTRLMQVVELFAAARQRHDRLGIYRR